VQSARLVRHIRRSGTVVVHRDPVALVHVRDYWLCVHCPLRGVHAHPPAPHALQTLTYNDRAQDAPGVKLALHCAVHVLGVHIYILTQVRQRKTFIKVRRRGCKLLVTRGAGGRVVVGAQGSRARDTLQREHDRFSDARVHCEAIDGERNSATG
jgi:hypothetical protein